jgi:SAM-dependent methyltransferase
VSGSEERLANDPSSELWGEHRARYRFAAQWARGQRVLDMASGSGFGVTMLREAGALACGFDYDLATRPDACADAAHLPVGSATFDLITSFETLEHVPDACAMVRELRRVLRPGGRLVLSTPNRSFRESNNPFHVREFTADELRSLLCSNFQDVTILGQRPTPAYRFVPFLMLRPTYAPAEVAWKLANRLPAGLKDRLAQALSGRPWYPGEADYVFDPDPTGAHALLAVAR